MSAKSRTKGKSVYKKEWAARRVETNRERGSEEFLYSNVSVGDVVGRVTLPDSKVAGAVVEEGAVLTCTLYGLYTPCAGCAVRI